MEKIQEIKKAIEACLAIEASESISIYRNTSYGNLFTNGELNLKHAKFPIRSLSTLTPTQAKDQIIRVYTAYSEKNFLSRLWWRIRSTQSIDTYAKLYNIIKLHDLRTELARIPSDIAINFTAFSIIIPSLLNIFLDYLSSFLRSHGFFTRLFEGHYMQMHTDIFSIPRVIDSLVEHMFKAEPPVVASKDSSFESELHHIDKHLEFTFQHFNTQDMQEAMDGLQTHLNTIKNKEIPKQYGELYAKVERKLEATLALLTALQVKEDIAPLITGESQAHLEAVIKTLEEQLQRVQYGCAIQHIPYNTSYKPQAFTYYIEFKKDNKTIKKIHYYGKDADEVEKNIPIPTLTDKEKNIKTALCERHQNHIKVSYAHNPNQRLEAFNKIPIKQSIHNLMQTYSLNALQELSEETDTKNAPSYAKSILAYKASVTRRFLPLLESYHQTQTLLQEEKSQYEQVLALIPAFRRKAFLIIVHAYSHTDIKAELEKLLKNELTERMQSLPALSLITKKQILAPIVSFIRVLDIISTWKPDVSQAMVSLFTKPTSSWREKIKQEFKPTKRDHMQEHFPELVEDATIRSFELILNKKPYNTSDLALAVVEIMSFNGRYEGKWLGQGRWKCNTLAAKKYAHSVREVSKMPADTLDAWNNWLIEERKHPKTLKQAFDNLVAHVKKPTQNPETNLIRYISLAEIALRLVEVNKWLDLGIKESPEDIIKILEDIWKKVYATIYHPDKHAGKDIDTIEIYKDRMSAFTNEKDKGCEAIRNAAHCKIKPSWINEEDNNAFFWEECRQVQRESFTKIINELSDKLTERMNRTDRQIAEIDALALKFKLWQASQQTTPNKNTESPKLGL